MIIDRKKMIREIDQFDNILELFSEKSIEKKLKQSESVLIKINMARVPVKNQHPRTDVDLLKSVVTLLRNYGKQVTIAESADGHLLENLNTIGLSAFLASNEIYCMDIDTIKFNKVLINNQEILIPQDFNKFDLRISIPCASKRDGALFSNNVKNFFGATPRIGYLREGEGRWRSRLHDNLTQSVINVFDAFEKYSCFDYYINGGNAFSEKRGPFYMDRIYLSDSAIELDKKIFKKYFEKDEKPEYLIKLENRQSPVSIWKN